MARTSRSSRPETTSLPLSHREAPYRYMAHGPILPMEEPGFFARLFARR